MLALIVTIVTVVVPVFLSVFLNDYCDVGSNVEKKAKFQFFSSSREVRTDEEWGACKLKYWD